MFLTSDTPVALQYTTRAFGNNLQRTFTNWQHNQKLLSQYSQIWTWEHSPSYTLKKPHLVADGSPGRREPTWCSSRRLQLNTDKTEPIWFGSKQTLDKVSRSVGPAACYSLPANIKLTTDTNRFKKLLKSHPFHVAFWQFVSAPGQFASRALQNPICICICNPGSVGTVVV